MAGLGGSAQRQAPEPDFAALAAALRGDDGELGLGAFEGAEGDAFGAGEVDEMVALAGAVGEVAFKKGDGSGQRLAASSSGNGEVVGAAVNGAEPVDLWGAAWSCGDAIAEAGVKRGEADEGRMGEGEKGRVGEESLGVGPASGDSERARNDKSGTRSGAMRKAVRTAPRMAMEPRPR